MKKEKKIEDIPTLNPKKIFDHNVFSNGHLRVLQYRDEFDDGTKVVLQRHVYVITTKKPWFNQRHGECFQYELELVN